MKKYLQKTLIALLLLVPAMASAQLTTQQGGTGSTTPSGLLYGILGNLHLQTVRIGTGLTFNGGTLAGSGFAASSTLLADFNTFTGQNMFLASTTIGNGTQAGGLTISGGATTTGASLQATTSIVTVNNALQGVQTPGFSVINNSPIGTSISNVALFSNNNAGGGNQGIIGFSTYSNYTTSFPASLRFIDDNFSNAFAFRTKTPGGSTNADVERMRITGTGFVGIGYSVPTTALDVNGTVGVGTSSPYAKLSVHANAVDTNQTLFAIGSSTATATTTLFSVSNAGQVQTQFGSMAAPAYSFSGSQSGMFMADSTTLDFGVTGSTVLDFHNGAARYFGDGFYGSGARVGWTVTAGPNAGNLDTAFSRLSAGKVALGNGTAQDSSGTLIASSSGFGSTTPWARVAIQATSIGTIFTTLFAIGSSTATATTTLFAIDNTGHIITGGTSPVVTACGTTPTIFGNDTNMTIYVGSGVVSSCTVTFVQPFANPAVCNMTQQTGAVVSITASTTPTAVVFGGTNMASDRFNFHCEGYQ